MYILFDIWKLFLPIKDINVTPRNRHFINFRCKPKKITTIDNAIFFIYIIIVSCAFNINIKSMLIASCNQRSLYAKMFLTDILNLIFHYLIRIFLVLSEAIIKLLPLNFLQRSKNNIVYVCKITNIINSKNSEL